MPTLVSCNNWPLKALGIPIAARISYKINDILALTILLIKRRLLFEVKREGLSLSKYIKLGKTAILILSLSKEDSSILIYVESDSSTLSSTILKFLYGWSEFNYLL